LCKRGQQAFYDFFFGHAAAVIIDFYGKKVSFSSSMMLISTSLAPARTEISAMSKYVRQVPASGLHNETTVLFFQSIFNSAKDGS